MELKKPTGQDIESQYDYNATVLAKPTGDDIRTARGKRTQKAAAEVVHRKDGARWREWESGRHPVDMAVWELFLIKTGLRKVPKLAK